MPDPTSTPHDENLNAPESKLTASQEGTPGKLESPALEQLPPHPAERLLRQKVDAAKIYRLKSIFTHAEGTGTDPQQLLAELEYILFAGGPGGKQLATELLTIDQIDPLRAWPYQPVGVQFTVTNHTQQATSGFVTADVTLGIERPLSSGFFTHQKSAQIVNLAPGHKASGTVELRHWTQGRPITPGQHDLILQYWVEDPNGTITIVSPRIDPSEEPYEVTYGSPAYDSASIDIYPSCSPNGPDHLEIQSFTPTPSAVMLDASGQSVTQPVSLSWSVVGGGFPPTGNHPGSVRTVTLTGPGIAKGGTPVGATGQMTVYLGGIPAALAQPFTLTAEGNCGMRQASFKLTGILPPPKIASLTAEPHDGYIYAGQSATLKWQVTDCQLGCNVSMQGREANGNLVLNEPHLPLAGSLSVKPVYDTWYTLTARSQGGSDTRTKHVQLYASPGTPSGSEFYFKMTSPSTSIVPFCFGIAVYASDEKTAQSLAEQENPGYKAESIDAATFNSGAYCP